MSNRSRQTTTTLAVAAIGSEAAGDDAIGLVLLDALARERRPGLQLYRWADADALTLAQGLLDLNRRLLLLDCADLGLTPGSWRCLSSEVAVPQLAQSSISTHGLGFAEALGIARTLGYRRPLNLFGVQPFDLSPRPNLSPAMAARVPILLAALDKSLQTLVTEDMRYPAPNSGAAAGRHLPHRNRAET